MHWTFLCKLFRRKTPQDLKISARQVKAALANAAESLSVVFCWRFSAAWLRDPFFCLALDFGAATSLTPAFGGRKSATTNGTMTWAINSTPELGPSVEQSVEVRLKSWIRTWLKGCAPFPGLEHWRKSLDNVTIRFRRSGTNSNKSSRQALA